MLYCPPHPRRTFLPRIHLRSPVVRFTPETPMRATTIANICTTIAAIVGPLICGIPDAVASPPMRVAANIGLTIVVALVFRPLTVRAFKREAQRPVPHQSVILQALAARIDRLPPPAPSPQGSSARRDDLVSRLLATNSPNPTTPDSFPPTTPAPEPDPLRQL